MYRFYIRKNGVAAGDLNLTCAEISVDNMCDAIVGSILYPLVETDYLEIWVDCEATKDFKPQAGFTFTMVRA